MVAMQGELASAAPTVPPSVRRGLAQAEQEKSGFDPCRAHHEILGGFPDPPPHPSLAPAPNSFSSSHR